MSGISLNTFVDRAKLSEGGDMRVSRDGGELVNKGTLGQKIVTLFKDIGQALGLVKQSSGEDRALRQEKALTGFREALTERYGAGLAEEALRSKRGGGGLDQPGARLTGRAVLATFDYADTLAKAATRSAGTISGSLQLNVAAGKIGVDPHKLTEQQSNDYLRHFAEAKNSALEGNAHYFGDAELQTMAEDALRSALKMPSMREERGREAIEGYVKDMKDTLTASLDAHGRSQNVNSLARDIDRKMQYVVKETLSLPKGEGPEAFRKLHQELTSDMKDFLAYVGRRGGVPDQNLDAEAQGRAMQLMSAAMERLLKVP